MEGSNNWMPGYDPNRIPTSVFASKPTIGWRVASSETFYSIQNDSFSTAEPIELPEAGEPSSEPAIAQSLPTVVEESRESPNSERTTTEVVNGIVRDRAEQRHNNVKTPPKNVQHSSTISISSNEQIREYILRWCPKGRHSKPETQSMTKEEPSQKESDDKEPQTSSQNVKGGWCYCWLKCFS